MHHNTLHQYPVILSTSKIDPGKSITPVFQWKSLSFPEPRMTTMILTEQLLLVCQGPTCEEPTMDWIRIFKVEDTKYILPKKTPKNCQNKLKSIYKKREK